VELLAAGTAKEDAAEALLELTWSHPENQVSSVGAIPPLVAMLGDDDGSDDGGAKSLAAAACWSLARKNPAAAMALTEAGAVPLLVDLLEEAAERTAVVNVAGALGCLVAGHEGNRTRVAGAIPRLVHILTQPAVEKANAARTLRHLAEDESNRRAMADAGAIPPLVELLRSSSKKGVATAADALRILALHDASHRDLVRSAGALRTLTKLRRSRKIPAEGLLLIRLLALM